MKDDGFDIAKDYKVLASRYNLPSFEDLDKEFELKSIDKPDYVLKNIRRKIHDKLGFFSKIVEGVIHPDSQNVTNIYESDFFSNEEKASLVSFHKKLLVFEREALLLDIECSDDKEVVFIKSLFNEWNFIKSTVRDLIVRMRDSWKKKESYKEIEERYFG